MTELETADILALMGRVGEVQWESVFGTTFPGYYALFATRHMHDFGTTRENLLQVAIKNHYYGARNPNALFQKEITMEKALASESVASPFCVYDCCANADGAACLILAKEDKARALAGDKVVWLDGVGSATASMSVLRRPNLTGLSSASEAASQAYDQAGVTAADIDVAEVHDCFTIAELMAYEDLGFCEKGQGGRYIEERRPYIGEGGVAINVDGGLKAKGHPIGATGVSMAYEICRQLRGECGERQVPNADVGLTHNVGGIGQYSFVHIFKSN
jgi:acetyl-CoA C-acetyltransferase